MLRLGVVSFLNARPLIDGLGEDRGVGCVFDVPAALPGHLDRGDVDAALIPVFDLLRYPGRYRVVSDACIGCDGETMTVRVFSQVPPHRIETLCVDPDSHTSVALARVLWRELFDAEVELLPLPASGEEGDPPQAVLLIGDKVVDPGRAGYGYEVDLGGAWRQHTGLPFVFAVWACRSPDRLDRPEVGPPHADTAVAPWRDRIADLSALLSAARDSGVARAAEIARTCGPALGWPVELAERYLTRCLKFDLDRRTIAGGRQFARLCAAAGLVSADVEIAWPIIESPLQAGGRR